MITDLWYGIGMDRVVKVQCEYSPTYMYVFRWKSYTDWLPWFLGETDQICYFSTVKLVIMNL